MQDLIRFVPLPQWSLPLFLVVVACQPGDRIEDQCTRFAEAFESVAIDSSVLSSDFLNQPLPETVRRLEAGYDASCVVGGVADIYVQCVTGDIVQTHDIIRGAPVIWTDPEGFTVLAISAQDHENLQGRELFWARCDSK